MPRTSNTSSVAPLVHRHPQVALQRGLQLLMLVNTHVELTAAYAARLADLSRPTAYRLLKALERMGFVRQDAITKRFAVTGNVLALSHGFRDEPWIQNTARPLLDDLSRKLLWPISLCAHVEGELVVRYGTDHLSPFPNYRNKLTPISLTETAAGTAFLAFTKPSLRGQLLELSHARHPSDVKYAAGSDRRWVLEQRLNRVRRDGFCSLHNPALSHAGFAVPILVDGAAVAVLSLRFYPSAMPANLAAKAFLQPLQRVARKIAAAIAVSSRKRPTSRPKPRAPRL